jgi:hypothetical protein
VIAVFGTKHLICLLPANSTAPALRSSFYYCLSLMPSQTELSQLWKHKSGKPWFEGTHGKLVAWSKFVYIIWVKFCKLIYDLSKSRCGPILYQETLVHPLSLPLWDFFEGMGWKLHGLNLPVFQMKFLVIWLTELVRLHVLWPKARQSPEMHAWFQ